VFRLRSRIGKQKAQLLLYHGAVLVDPVQLLKKPDTDPGYRMPIRPLAKKNPDLENSTESPRLNTDGQKF
jgi:hypothetical protein